MTSFQDKLDALPEIPSYSTVTELGHSEVQRAFALSARLALARELLEETLRLLQGMTPTGFAKHQKADAVAFLSKLDSEGI